MTKKDNVFHYDDPDNYFCLVVSYVVDLPQLLVEVRKLDSPEFRPNSYIVFTGIEYFEGPLKWIGTNFRIRTQKELKKMIGHVKPWPENKPRRHPMLTFNKNLFLETNNLYEAKSLGGTTIRIIAGGASKHSKYPFPLP